MKRSSDDFEAFAAAQLRPLLRPAYYLVGDWDEAEDMVQVTLIKMYKVWNRLGPEHDPVAYSRTVLLNVFRDAHRDQQRRSRRMSRLRAQADRAGHTEIPDVAERDAHAQLLMRLPPGQRAVLVLRFLDDLSVEQTAECLGISLGTVKSQTAAGLSALRLSSSQTGDLHG